MLGIIHNPCKCPDKEPEPIEERTLFDEYFDEYFE